MGKSVIKPLTLEIEKELWAKFKDKIPRSITLNEAIVNLIKKEVEENGGGKNEIHKNKKKDV